MGWATRVYQNVKDAEREQNKKRNIEQCGSKHGHLDSYSGDFKVSTFFCHYHRECPICLQRRENEYIGRLERFSSSGHLLFRTSFETENQLRGFLRKVGVDNYLRCPTDDVFVVYHGEEWQNDNSQMVILDNKTKGIIASDFNTPEGYRITGNLGKRQEKEEAGPKGRITYKVYALSAIAPQMLAQAKGEAKKVGLGLPVTEESLQEAISCRESILEQWFRGRGVAFPIVYTVTTEIALNRVNWSIVSMKESPVSNDEWVDRENTDQTSVWEPYEVFKEPDLG